jgi:hypothetical protein
MQLSLKHHDSVCSQNLGAIAEALSNPARELPLREEEFPSGDLY